MAHFAELNESNIVVNVIKIEDSLSPIGDLSFPESEEVGIQYINTFLPGRIWRQTSYNHNFRFRYAGNGYEFHPECGSHGGFCPPRPYEDWVFNQELCIWEAPVPLPEDSTEKRYIWDPTQHNWKLYE